MRVANKNTRGQSIYFLLHKKLILIAGTLITDLKADLYSYRSKNFTNIWNSAKNLPKQNVSFLQSNDVTNADKVFHHI